MEAMNPREGMSQQDIEKRREYMKHGLELAKEAMSRENSGVTLDNLTSKAFDVAVNLAALNEDVARTFPETLPPPEPTEPPLPTPEEVRKSIGKKAIKCLVCGEEFRLLSAKHLATHGLTAETYREKFGLPKRFGLCCQETKKLRADIIPKDRLLAARTQKKAEAPSEPGEAAPKEKKTRTRKPKATPQEQAPEPVEASEVTETFEATEGTIEE